MSGPGALLAWLGLMLALAAEAGLAFLPWGRTLAPLIGLGMALAVAVAFMRLSSAPRAGLVFVLAGTFWVAAMLCMGQLDFATRHPVRAPRQTPTAIGE